MRKKFKETVQAKRGIYLLPNLITTGGLFAGFYSVVSALKGHFEVAAMAIFIAMIADFLDGRIARLTNTQSPFGEQYDSLADMLSFGVAPALVVYSWAFQDLGRLGWLCAFLYTATTALRLARFNVQTKVASKRYFYGLSCPSAAAILASMIWLVNKYQISGDIVNYIFCGATILVSALMVSNIRYYSFKEVNFKERVPFWAVLLVLLVLIVVFVNPPLLLFTAFTVYALSGPLTWVWTFLRRTKKKTKPAS